MRSREEVLREFLPENEWDDYDPQFVMELMADRIRELEAWKGAALRVGEELSDTGPRDYYGFTPEQWQAWALMRLATIKGGGEDAELSVTAALIAASEPVSKSYTLPDTVQAIVDAAAAYEKKHGHYQDYRLSLRDDAFPVDKTERAIVVAYRKHAASEVRG